MLTGTVGKMSRKQTSPHEPQTRGRGRGGGGGRIGGQPWLGQSQSYDVSSQIILVQFRIFQFRISTWFPVTEMISWI